MSLGILLIFLLISPGFCLATGMRWGSQYDLKAKDGDSSTQLVTLIIFAVCIQILIAPLYFWFVQSISDIKFGEIADKDWGFFFTSDKKIDFYRCLAVGLYLVVSYGLSFLAGLVLIRWIEFGGKKIPFFHGFVYELIAGKGDAHLFCSILTKTNHENYSVMYRGVLEEISYSKENKINYITMSEAYRYLFKIDPINQKIKTTNKERVSYFADENAGDEHPEILYINGDEISNLLMTNYPFAGSNFQSRKIRFLLILSLVLLMVLSAFVLDLILKDLVMAIILAAYLGLILFACLWIVWVALIIFKRVRDRAAGSIEPAGQG